MASSRVNEEDQRVCGRLGVEGVVSPFACSRSLGSADATLAQRLRAVARELLDRELYAERRSKRL
jgi:hypothetical protein